MSFNLNCSLHAPFPSWLRHVNIKKPPATSQAYCMCPFLPDLDTSASRDLLQRQMLTICALPGRAHSPRLRRFRVVHVLCEPTPRLPPSLSTLLFSVVRS
ncbi:hypothetical protein BDV98DRAFT_231162 [Pterulicium gracile]|uniref:Uncharacterized protein n=1 Tax=Pterulicium gracile TaxID=1884261 RepID=A0A5C3QY52_9AGAR|nr:hypothetical protein BDV98DRAFT_231162 [Pterula gracilis]